MKSYVCVVWFCFTVTGFYMAANAFFRRGFCRVLRFFRFVSVFGGLVGMSHIGV